MEHLIKDLEALNGYDFVNENAKFDEIWCAAIDAAIEILRNQPVIKAKALRKRGTDKWYYGSETLVMEVDDLLPYYNEIPTILPEDAELIDIEIITKTE
jgi:hypothetical protein